MSGHPLHPVPIFSAPYAPPDTALLPRLGAEAATDAPQDAAIEADARGAIEAIRASRSAFGDMESLLQAYALSTREGVALMVLAEALLRVPDAATADRLIEDKLGQGGFADAHAHGEALLVNASAWALGLSARLVAPHDDAPGILAAAARRIGVPAIRAATRHAMRLMGEHFVLGETIEAALGRAASDRRYRYSFDMLGEGALTAADADVYRDSYAHAIAAIGRAAGSTLPDRPGISIKLSALSPRYEPLHRDRALRRLGAPLLDLARAAKDHDLNLTVDAEEAERLELSLEIFASVLADPSLAGWDGFGLAIQAYQKRCLAVVDHVAELAAWHGRRLMVRLVKGAYWDGEVKRAQVSGLADYPVFTDKAATDLAYEAAAARLLAARPRLFPQFATHNALTVAAIAARAGPCRDAGFEFQRLHGMGDALYAHRLEREPGFACRTYAPVGAHRDLLAYLVRRLLENGANTSFVARATNAAVPIEDLLRRPAASLRTTRAVQLPADMFQPTRRNSTGVAFGERAAFEALLAEVRDASAPIEATSCIDGAPVDGTRRRVRSPIDHSELGTVAEANAAAADAAMTAARRGASGWAATPVHTRAARLDAIAEAFTANRGRLLALLQAEGGKTLDDALAEWREAVDFCRYYAAEGRRLFGAPAALPGPTGERNTLAFRARGTIVAISPWNFPLAIFTGQIVAALMAGNAVVAKPAEQTALTGALATKLMHQAGIPTGALHLVLGDGSAGARLVAHPDVAGVVFTGSGEVAGAINRTLAARDGPIVPLVAETGGINAMIVDATALPEQVADDVVASAFRSAGQRCSALRLLLLQEDVADRMLDMIVGAARELEIGDPRKPSTDIGPVIDEAARDALVAHVDDMRASARILFAGQAPRGGLYVAPHIVELPHPGALRREVFGPILHVVRYRAHELDAMLEDIDGLGYGLTLGIHSRIEATVERIVARLRTGNVYVNRNMIGAVVGSQPFGGNGLSGTGPKAGGPHYLARLAMEQTVTINTAAIGGDVALMAAR